MNLSRSAPSHVLYHTAAHVATINHALQTIIIHTSLNSSICVQFQSPQMYNSYIEVYEFYTSIYLWIKYIPSLLTLFSIREGVNCRFSTKTRAQLFQKFDFFLFKMFTLYPCKYYQTDRLPCIKTLPVRSSTQMASGRIEMIRTYP